jgi:hypothetical protein
MVNIEKFDAYNIFKPDFRYQKLLNYTWREYTFHLIKEVKQDKDCISISLGEMFYPIIIDIAVLFDFRKSGDSMEIGKHIFDIECLNGVCNEIEDWTRNHETKNTIQESVV